MFEEIASEAYELSSDTKEKSHLPQQVVDDWWEILHSYPFQMCDVVVPGVSTSNEYLSSISQHIQRIRSISNADFDLLSNMSLTTHPYHTTYDNFGSDMVPIDPSDEKSVTFEEKPEIKIRLKLSSQTSHQPNVSLESGKSSKGIKLKLTLPPPPESERSRDSASHRSPSREDAPLSRTRGKRLPLSFLQSVTDIDLLPTESGNEATVDSDPLLLPGDDEVWKEEEEEEDFLNDTDAREQIRADYIEDYLDNDEYEHSKSQSKKRKVVSRHERASPPSVVQAPKKSKQKLGPGALLRKKLSGKYL